MTSRASLWWEDELTGRGRYEEAIAVLKKALDRAPDDSATYISLGQEGNARAATSDALRINSRFP